MSPAVLGPGFLVVITDWEKALRDDAFLTPRFMYFPMSRSACNEINVYGLLDTFVRDF